MENWEQLPQLIARDFNLNDSQAQWSKSADFQAFRLQLIAVIETMLAQQPEQLAQAMYRLDVDEAAFRQALAQNSPAQIADLVIRRELQKIYTRRQYSS
ncbi:MAG: hypothetical protein MUE85_16165 [Microscillaceae bacterium]|nr:hypothetical protein [Microscillaceae bacterium]